MRYLILGGNGYIGSKVVHLLLEDGHDLLCTKRLNSDMTRVKDVFSDIKWINTDLNEIDSALKTYGCDYVLNLACNYGRSDVLYDGVIEANIEFPLKVLNIATVYGIKRFMTIGTGLPSDFNMYSFSKKMFGNFGKFYSEKHEMNFNTLLLQMFYGADEPKDRFLPMIINKMIHGEEIATTIGTQRRDIICVEDVIKAIFLIIDSDLSGYNEIPVGTGEAPTISEIVDYIWEKTNKKSIVHKGGIPMRPDEPDCIADITFLKSIGEWNPIPWKMGIAHMIESMIGVNLK